MDRVDAMALYVAAIEAGSLSGAARKTGLSLSSVSRHLTVLEERVGARLMLRTTRKLVQTEAGRLYYEHAKRLLAEIEEIEATLSNDATNPTGRLQVCGPTLFGRAYLLPLLARFLVTHPRIVLDVILLDRPVNLVDEGFDLVIRIGKLEDSSLIARKLGTLGWVIAAAPTYLEVRGTPQTLADLAHHDCLVFSQHSGGAEWRLLRDGKPVPVRVPVRMRSNTLDGVVTAAVAGAGIVYAPAWAVARHVAAGRLKTVLREAALPPLPINAVVTHNRLQSGKVRALLDFVAEDLRSTDFEAAPPDVDRIAG